MPLLPLDLGHNVAPTVSINSIDIPDLFKDRLICTVVDTHLHLPDMFELTFEDSSNSIISDLMIRIGGLVKIFGGASGDSAAPCLIDGEVTSIEGEYHGAEIRTIVRGYEKSHRLQRSSKTRTFVDMTDSDIARQIAQDAKFSMLDMDITSTRAAHRHVSQIAQTDWEFLRFRAQEIGFETGVAQGKFYFREASSASGFSLSMLPGGPATLTFQENLRWFRPRLSSANLPAQVEVRVYDYDKADVVVGKADLKTGTAKVEEDPDPKALASSFTGLPIPIPSLPSIPGLPSLGVMPSQDARQVVNRPLDWGTPTSRSVDEMAKGIAETIASTVLEAEGMAFGNPGIQAGQKVVIAGVAPEFAGDWIVTAAHHIFVPEDGGYSTRFEVSGRHDRSLLGLVSLGQSSARPARLDGHVIGVVTNANDPDKMGRVKLAFPWLAPNYESDWARVVQQGMGKEWGNLFIPEVGDEVLVGFEFGDARRPYVMGGLINGKNKHPLLSSAVKSAGASAQIVKRGIVTRTGNQLTFEDEIPSPLTPTPPTTGKIVLGDKDAKLQIQFDTVKGELTITCNGGATNPIGKIVIEQKSQNGTIMVKSAGDVTVEAANPGKLTLKGGMGVSIDGGTGQVEIKGMGATLDAGAGMATIKGSQVKLN